MSCSKPLPPFVCDSLYYLNRNQLELFSIVCHSLKNFIERYLHKKPYRVLDELWMDGRMYRLYQNNAQWHPNRDDYSVQQFLAGEALHNRLEYYSFAEMRPYLDQTVRIKKAHIYLDVSTTCNPEHIEEMESIAHLWCDREISLWKEGRVVAKYVQPILDSPTIMQCQRAGAKPLLYLSQLHHQSIKNVLDHLSKAFSSAVLPNAFKIVFAANRKPLTEFRETNKTSGERLELKRCLITKCQYQNFCTYFDYILERCSI